ncbi:DUF3231 family protein [Paenibacillus mucilaginosus]|uniref:DUF3231 family protein n=2 Tax=Paenibacillus mucilaginosus TaxID=61624 RepID=F8F7N1_PAEMK|nr:hypothetical protein KNP414_00926 [Paenibacillus mucilaginosus KNP414]WDM28475.1 DUF3231 family protein [Paenibacillus mucilaginosus]
MESGDEKLMSTPTPRLTGSEIGYLWTGYMIDDMSQCVLGVFEQQAGDPDVLRSIALALNLARSNNQERTALLTGEGFPLPRGFAESDCAASLPALFGERFFLYYLLLGARLGLHFYAESLSVSIRQDVRSFCAERLSAASRLYGEILDTMLSKGLYIRPPVIPVPEAPEQIQKPSFLQGWFGDTRPLHSVEIANVYKGMELAGLIHAVCTAFAQTMERKDLQSLCTQGAQTAVEHLERLGGLLERDDLPLPPSLLSDVSGSQTPLFSERLMLCHISGLFGSLITHYGQALGSAMKHDVVAAFLALIAGAGNYTEDVTEALIRNEWLEKTPGALDRESLLEHPK